MPNFAAGEMPRVRTTPKPLLWKCPRFDLRQATWTTGPPAPQKGMPLTLHAHVQQGSVKLKLKPRGCWKQPTGSEVRLRVFRVTLFILLWQNGQLTC